MMMLFREDDRKPADRPRYPKGVYHDRLRGMADDVRRHSRCAEARIGLLATDDLLQPQRP